MLVGARETLEQQALDERLIEVRLIARAIDRNVRMQGLDKRRAAATEPQREAVLLANDVGHGAAHENGAAGFELRQHALMHLAWQAMAMRVPERPHMTQEATLFLRREIEPAFLDERPQAVDYRLPRRAVRLGRLAGEANGRREPRHAFGLWHGDFERHDALCGMPPRQLAAARNDGGDPAKAIAPRSDQGIDHGQA